MKHLKKFEGLEEGWTVDQKRLERLRNLLTPLINLPMMMEDNEDGKMDEIVQSQMKTALDVIPLVREALREEITMEELKKLYL